MELDPTVTGRRLSCLQVCSTTGLICEILLVFNARAVWHDTWVGLIHEVLLAFSSLQGVPHRSVQPMHHATQWHLACHLQGIKKQYRPSCAVYLIAHAAALNP